MRHDAVEPVAERFLRPRDFGRDVAMDFGDTGVTRFNCSASPVQSRALQALSRSEIAQMNEVKGLGSIGRITRVSRIRAHPAHSVLHSTRSAHTTDEPNVPFWLGLLSRFEEANGTYITFSLKQTVLMSRFAEANGRA